MSSQTTRLVSQHQTLHCLCASNGVIKTLEVTSRHLFLGVLFKMNVVHWVVSGEILHMMEQSNVSMEDIDPVPLDHV